MARHLNTHPFDERVTGMNDLQVRVFLELRHPYDPEAAQDEKIKLEAEENDARERYHLGDVEMPPEDTPDDDFNYALESQ